MIFQRDSRMEKVVTLRSKFNGIVNKLAESYDNNVLNIEVCEKNDFDFFGRLNTTGKRAYWSKINRLLERFDKGKTKLSPKKPSQTFTNFYSGGFN